MYKLIAALSALVMLLSLSACGSSASVETGAEPDGETKEEADMNDSVEEDSEPSSDEDLCGGWTLPDGFTPAPLPGDVQYAFDTAAADYTDAVLEPAVFLAEQTVAGTNYAILCRTDNSYWTIAFIYADLDGGAELLAVKDFPLGDYTHIDSVKDAEALQGGWMVVLSDGASMTDESQAVFDQLPENDRNYHAVALLGTQAAAGTNYAILAASGAGSMESPYQLTVLTIDLNLDGNAELVSACDLDIADFADFY